MCNLQYGLWLTSYCKKFNLCLANRQSHDSVLPKAQRRQEEAFYQVCFPCKLRFQSMYLTASFDLLRANTKPMAQLVPAAQLETTSSGKEPGISSEENKLEMDDENPF